MDKSIDQLNLISQAARERFNFYEEFTICRVDGEFYLGCLMTIGFSYFLRQQMFFRRASADVWVLFDPARHDDSRDPGTGRIRTQGVVTIRTNHTATHSREWIAADSFKMATPKAKASPQAVSRASDSEMNKERLLNQFSKGGTSIQKKADSFGILGGGADCAGPLIKAAQNVPEARWSRSQRAIRSMP